MSSTSIHPLRTLDSLASRWQHRKQTSSHTQRLGMHLLEIFTLAGAMFIVPTGIHRIVQSMDEVYELVGRRARSPYAGATPFMSVLAAVVMLVGWHVWLGRLSYKAIMEDDGDVNKAEGKGGSSWGRILGRIVMPLLLLSFGMHFGYQILGKLTSPTKFVNGNVNDGVETGRELRGEL